MTLLAKLANLGAIWGVFYSFVWPRGAAVENRRSAERKRR